MKNSILSVACLLLLSSFATEVSATPRPENVQAYPASGFLNSIGVCVHVQHGQDASRIAPLLRYTGVRNVRDAADRNYDMSGLLLLNKEAGVRLVIGPGSGARDADLAATVAAAKELHEAGALLAVEGPNEPNNFGGLTYQGQSSAGENGTWVPVAKFQRDLYKAVKEDPALGNYPVFSSSEMGAQSDNAGLQFLVIPEGAGTLMPDGTRFADYANAHNYMYHPKWGNTIHDNQVWNAADPTSACMADGLHDNFGLTWMKKFPGYPEDELLTLPRVTTETGVRVGDMNGAVTEEVQANNYLNVFLAQFKRGWSYTFIYEFLDDPDGAFGFYKSDYTTARKSAHYMHNFTGILQDGDRRFKPGKLAYEIPSCPETTHDLLLQKSDGSFFLVVWSEKAKGSDKVKVVFGKPHKNIRVYDPTSGTSVVRELKKAGEVELEVSDHPFILAIDN